MQPVTIDVEGERFEVSTRRGPQDERIYDFTWINGPGPSTYGFTVGSTAPTSSSLSPDEIEATARGFIESFYAPDGIGPSDFSEFVASRRRS